MMNISEFIKDNYIWFLVILLIAIITVIGFLADKNNGKKKEKNAKGNKDVNKGNFSMQVQPNNINDSLNTMAPPSNLEINNIPSNSNLQGNTVPQPLNVQPINTIASNQEPMVNNMTRPNYDNSKSNNVNVSTNFNQLDKTVNPIPNFENINQPVSPIPNFGQTNQSVSPISNFGQAVVQEPVSNLGSVTPITNQVPNFEKPMQQVNPVPNFSYQTVNNNNSLDAQSITQPNNQNIGVPNAVNQDMVNPTMNSGGFVYSPQQNNNGGV